MCNRAIERGCQRSGWSTFAQPSHRLFNLPFLILLLCAVTACSSDRPRPPVSFPFSVLEKGAMLVEEIEVIEYRPYVFELTFESPDGQDIPRIRRLLIGDGRPENSGVTLPIKMIVWNLGNESQSPIFEQLINTRGANSWSSTDISRHVGYVSLRPGTYRIQVTNVEAKAEFENIRVKFLVGIPPKSAIIKEK